VLDDIITTTGRTPAHIRMDNGTEMTAHAMTDWCRFTGVDPSFIDPASPWQNGTCESFNGRFRDEFLITEQFGSLLEVQVLADASSTIPTGPTARWASSPPRHTGTNGPTNRAPHNQRSHKHWHHNRGPVKNRRRLRRQR